MTTLPTSLKLFSSLSRSSGAVWAVATNRKAPHKPLLLLALLDLVHCSVITACGGCCEICSMRICSQFR